MRRLFLLAAPTVAVLVVAMLPLIGGGESIYLRDVTAVHLPMKHGQAEAWTEGRLPLVEPLRAGGQPSLGNPNAVPLYPDNLLFLVAPFLWAFNAHFWLHLLLAPWCGYWMARAWGQERAAAWATGTLFAVSGFFLSQLVFYNLVAGVALAPALIAACLDASGERPRRAAAVALLWCLVLLAGDPGTAAQAGLLAAAAVAVRRGRALPRALPRLVTAVGVGSLLAAPGLVAFLRILPASYRGFHGYRGLSGMINAWDPRLVVEWFLPFAFGRPDLVGPGRFWGFHFTTGVPPLYFSLYPGLLALLLVAAAPRPRCRDGSGWAWGSIGAGLVLAAGPFVPFLTPFFREGTSLMRYPVKLWLPVAVGASLLGGAGLARIASGRTRTLRAATAALAIGYLALWGVLTFLPQPVERAIGSVLPKATAVAGFAANERLRWAGLCLFSLAALAALTFVLRQVVRRRRGAVPFLLALHAALQLLFLAPLRPTESAAELLRAPAILAELPPSVPIVHGPFSNLIGPSTLERGPFPTNDVRWLTRRAREEAYPFVGMLHGRRYELNVSPEGLDSFLTRAARDALRILDDADRLRLLRIWGVGRLVLHRELDPGLGAQLLDRIESEGHTAWLYALPDAVPAPRLVGRARSAADPAAALATLLDPTFDPTAEVVVAGEAPRLDGDPAVLVSSLEDGDELRLTLRPGGAAIAVLPRAHLPIYRATADGVEVPVRVADLHRLAVEVPAGARELRVAPDRRPLHWSLAASALGLLALLGLARPVSRGRGSVSGMIPRP